MDHRQMKAFIELFTNVRMRDLLLTAMMFLSQGDTGEAGAQGNPGQKVGHSLMKQFKKEFSRVSLPIKLCLKL